MHVTAAENRGSFPAFSWLGPPEEHRRLGVTNPFRDRLADRSGIIFIENFWDCHYGLFHGSHIDLWSGRLRRTKNELYYRGSWFPDHRFDSVADRVVFWEVLDDDTPQFVART